MAARKFHKRVIVTTRMAIRTEATSTNSTNSKYNIPKPRIPATDPKHIQNLWCQVRKQKCGNMALNQQPKYMADTITSSTKNKTTRDISGTSITLSRGSTTPTSKSQSITIKNPGFREKCLMPRGISINARARSTADSCAHFHTDKPPSYRGLEGLGESTLWLDTDPAFIEKVNKEYIFMNHYHLCEAEYASFAKENLLKREPREEIFDNIEDRSQRFRRAERMLEFVCKPDDEMEWKEPPLLPSFNKSDYPTYAFDIRPDCSYWLALHAFSSTYAEQAREVVHIPQERMTCPYFTVEFKRDDSAKREPSDQVATFGALALYNRYQLRDQAVSEGWTHEQECQLRHYGLTITKSSYTFWCIRPILNGGKWNGCNMDRIFIGLLKTKQGVKCFVDWINEIHRWGLTNHMESCERDIRTIAQQQNLRVSLDGSKKECTCDNSVDAAGTSEQEPCDPAQALG